jgi:succinyl-diaminopimelate desuccinylase
MEEIVQLIKDLIRFKSIHAHPQKIIECADFIETYLKNHGLVYQRVEYNGIPSIIALPHPGFAPILLMSHFDVVHGSDELFEPFEKEGKLFGRGSLDDKYGVALSLVLFKEHCNRLKEQKKDQKHLPFGIVLTGDEEVGGEWGAKEILKSIKSDFCIALDGGEVERIIIREKGILKLRMISRGKAAHSSRPWLGENAIEKLMTDYQVVKTLFRETKPDNWQRTLNLSIIKGGESSNQVPDQAEAIIDIRYTEKDDPDELIQKIQKAIKGELLVEEKEPLFEGGESPYLELLLKIAKDSRLGFEHGASDARFLAKHGIKGIVWGANGDLSAHSQNEHVNIDSLFRLYHILNEFMQRAGEVSIIA